MLHFHIITLFPESIEPYLASSIIGRALAAKKIKISFYDPKNLLATNTGASIGVRTAAAPEWYWSRTEYCGRHKRR